MGAPSKIIELVNRFREQQDSYRTPSYGEAADQEIDRLVYELYGLTDEEIRIVEETTAR